MRLPKGQLVGKQGSDRYRIETIDRAALILSCFDFDRVELTVRDVVERTGLHKATAHRVLMALNHNGFVERDADSGLYRLGLVLFHLGEVAVSRLTLREVAGRFLRDLTDKTQETSHVAVLDGLDVLYVDKIEGPHALRMPSRLGRRIPAYCTSLGKAMLSCLTDDQVRQLFKGHRFVAHTSRTVRDVDALLRDLVVVRRRGWAVDDEEIEAGLRCVGAPIHDYTGGLAGAISVAAPSARLRKEQLPEFGALAMSSALAISRRLGFGRLAGRPSQDTAADAPRFISDGRTTHTRRESSRSSPRSNPAFVLPTD